MRDGKHVILCVDDDSSVRDWMEIVLGADGYAVETAASAEEGRAKFRQTSPDLVIADLMMEEVDAGASLARDLRAFGFRGPLYMLSSVGEELSQQSDPEELGLDGVFQKPCLLYTSPSPRDS